MWDRVQGYLATNNIVLNAAGLVVFPPGEDLASIVVHLRSLPPVHHELPDTEIIFPVKYLIRSVPQPLTGPVPDILADANSPKYAAHMAKVTGCADCHTPTVQGDEVKDMD